MRWDLSDFGILLYARDLSITDWRIAEAESDIKPTDMTVGQSITVRYTKRWLGGWYRLRRTQ